MVKRSKKGSKKRSEEIKEEEWETEEDLEDEEEYQEEELDDEDYEDIEDDDLEEEDEDYDDDEDDEDYQDEDDDDEEEEDLDDEDIDDNGEEKLSRKDIQDERGKKFITIGIVVLMIISALGIGLIISFQADDPQEKKEDDDKELDPYDDLGNDLKSTNQIKACISEVNPQDEWFEVYIMGEGPGTTEGWQFTTFDEPLTDIQAVSAIGIYSTIIFHSGNGTDDLDCSDGDAVVFLGIGDDVLDDDGDEISLFDSSNNIIDFVGWGSGNGDTPRDGWSLNDYAPVPDNGSTISLIGEDRDESSDWMITLPSINNNALVEIDLADEGFNETIQIMNGRRSDQVIDTNGTWNRQLVIKARGVIKRGGPLQKKDLEDVLEYSSHTYKTLRKMGFDVPEVTGHKENGKPFLRIIVTKNGDYEGYYDADNRTVHVDLGSNKYASKQTVEHEVFHAFQMKQRADGSRAMNPNKEQGFDEGMAEFIGRYSTVTNFKNLTWLELEKQLKIAGSMNIFNLTTDLEKDVFGDWPGSGDLSDHYEMNFLFIKYLMDRFGMDIIKKIFDSTKNFGSQEKEEGDVTGIDAIEAATGKKFEDLLLEFMVWRVDRTKFSQYEKSNEWPGYDVDSSKEFKGETLDDEEYIDDLVTIVNEYILNGTEAVITVKPDDKTTLGITVIIEHANGTKQYLQKKLEPGTPGVFRIPPGVKKATVLKTSLKKTELGGSFKIRVQGGAVVTPMGPPDNDHIMWDPDPRYIEWILENLTDDLGLELMIDNTSTFNDPWYDWTLPWNTTSFPIPADIPNGTWWWKIGVRWEDGTIDPWTDPWNFTVWRDFDRPEIMWDPDPARFENLSGSWGLITPDTRIRVTPRSTPPGMNIEEGIPQFRLCGPGGTIDLVADLDDWFDVGDHMTGNHNTIEWRVDFPPYTDIPWFRDDILWDPVPPELVLLPDLPGPRVRENETAQIGLNDTYHVDSFFDIYYSIDVPESGFNEYMVDPVFNRTEDGLMIYDLFLNFSELDEGVWTFNITVVDEVGRRSEPFLMDFIVDRTGPEFNIETEPSGDPTYFNGSFNVTIWSDDPTAESVLLEIHDSQGSITQMDMVTPVPPWSHEAEWKGIYDQMGQPLPEGPITIFATVWDDIGNIEVGSIDAIIDTTAPSPIIIEPSNEDWLFLGNSFETRVDVNESASEIVSVSAYLIHAEHGWENVSFSIPYVYGQIYAVNNTLSWNLVPDHYWLEIRVIDRAGNTGIDRVLVQLILS